MQIVIDKMNDAKDNFPGMGFGDEFMRGFNKAFQIAIIISKEAGLPKEREQIVEAWRSGDINFNHKETAEQYFKNKYEQK